MLIRKIVSVFFGVQQEHDENILREADLIVLFILADHII
jgi:hypothetical protein